MRKKIIVKIESSPGQRDIQLEDVVAQTWEMILGRISDNYLCRITITTSGKGYCFKSRIIIPGDRFAFVSFNKSFWYLNRKIMKY